MNAKRVETKPAAPKIAPKPAPSKAVALGMKHVVSTYDQFQAQLEARREEIEAILPNNVTYDRLIKTALIAVKNDPDLLKADRKSLHRAVTQAAEDGIFPDGREGSILSYKTKVKDQFVQLAQWMPMVKGIRRRARELAGLIIDTQVVCKNDHFLWVQGDEPRIEHRPADLGEEPGPIVGAFAVIRHPTEGVVHREVMRIKDINEVRNVSRAKDGPMWTKHFAEACRKTVARRAMKSVPTVMELDRIVRREDAHSDYAPAPAAPSNPGGDIPSPDARHDDTPSRDAQDLEPVDAEDEGEAVAAETAASDEASQAEDGAAEPSLLDQFCAALNLTTTGAAANKIWSRFDDRLREAGLENEAIGAFEEHTLKLANR